MSQMFNVIRNWVVEEVQKADAVNQCVFCVYRKRRAGGVTFIFLSDSAPPFPAFFQHLEKHTSRGRELGSGCKRHVEEKWPLAVSLGLFLLTFTFLSRSYLSSQVGQGFLFLFVRH
jgi:hypothetical protein